MGYVFGIPRKIISGQDALNDAGKEVATMGQKALVVTDSTMEKLGNVAKVLAVLTQNGVESVVYSAVNHEPDTDIVKEGVAQYQLQGCDFLIGLGGGSPIDTMKAIAMISVLGGAPADYLGKEIHAVLPPMVAIPTTAGTGSEATQFTIISDKATNIKMLLKGTCLLPDLAIVDAAFTLSAPPAVTASTGIDALCHAVEAFTSRKAQPLSDTFARSAVKRIFTNLEETYKNPYNIEARSQMALAATEAGVAFNNASVTLIHGMSRPIGALFHVPHGLSNAMLILPCLQFAKSCAFKRFAELARYCSLTSAETSDMQAADDFLNTIAQLTKSLHIQTLQDFGVIHKEFEKWIPKMADDALASGSPANTLRDVTKKDITDLYLSLWKK